jgi:hypothetical protein
LGKFFEQSLQPLWLSTAQVKTDSICVLDFDGDLTDWLLTSGLTQPHPGWACFHTTMHAFQVDGMECALIARIIGGPYAVLVAEQLHVSGAQVILGLTLAGRVTLFISSQPGHSNQCYSRQSEPCAERVERFWISLSDDNAGVALSAVLPGDGEHHRFAARLTCCELFSFPHVRIGARLRRPAHNLSRGRHHFPVL